MPIAARLAQTVGMLFKTEAVYGTAETLSNSTDGFFMYLGDGDPPNPAEINYVYDGMIGRAPGNLVNQKQTTPAGANRPFEVAIQARGLGSLYSAILVPPNEVHRGLQASGFTPSYSAMPTPQWKYDPSAPGAFTGGTSRFFGHGSQWDGFGVLFALSVASEGLGVPIWTYRAVSIAGQPIDQTLPAVTYAQANILPPVAQGVTLTLGAFTPSSVGSMVRSVRLELNAEVDKPRIGQNIAGGHAGFTRGRMVPELVVVLERPARTDFDPEALKLSAANVPVVWGVGGTQYNRWRFEMPNAQVVGAAPGADNDVATVEVRLRGHGSTPSANDACFFLLN